MLTIFKDQSPLTPNIPSDWLKTQWRRFLDKGIIPSQSEIDHNWRREFPETVCPDFSEWIKSMSPCWPINGASAQVREIFCHRNCLIESVGVSREKIQSPLAPEDWQLWIETLATYLKIEFNYTHPCVSHYLEHKGSQWRVTMLHSSISSDNCAKVFFRQLSSQQISLNSFSLDATGVELIESFIKNKKNILVAGSTGSGKTTMLSSMLQYVEEEEHIVMLEDTQEITCHHPRLTRLISTHKEGRSLNDYLAHTLRISPDRIILGEMRSHEVIPYLLAMNTGHKGLISTLHASSAMDALLRVAQLFVLASGQKEINYQEVLKLVCRNVGQVIFMEDRKVKEVITVFGSDGDQPLYDRIM